MSESEPTDQQVQNNVHPLLEIVLIEAYLQGKGYSIEGLQTLPEEQARQLMKEASTYASGKLAEVEVNARLIQVLHDAYVNE
jgi:hypothetical protein